jgi:hypothetical protein
MGAAIAIANKTFNGEKAFMIVFPGLILTVGVRYISPIAAIRSIYAGIGFWLSVFSYQN